MDKGTGWEGRMTIPATILVLRILTAPADLAVWDSRGERMPIVHRGGDRVEVLSTGYPVGTVGVRCHNPDAGAVPFRMEHGRRWWRATVECGDRMFYVDTSIDTGSHTSPAVCRTPRRNGTPTSCAASSSGPLASARSAASAERAWLSSSVCAPLRRRGGLWGGRSCLILP